MHADVIIIKIKSRSYICTIIGPPVDHVPNIIDISYRIHLELPNGWIEEWRWMEFSLLYYIMNTVVTALNFLIIAPSEQVNLLNIFITKHKIKKRLKMHAYFMNSQGLLTLYRAWYRKFQRSARLVKWYMALDWHHQLLNLESSILTCFFF